MAAMKADLSAWGLPAMKRVLELDTPIEQPNPRLVQSIDYESIGQSDLNTHRKAVHARRTFRILIEKR